MSLNWSPYFDFSKGVERVDGSKNQERLPPTLPSAHIAEAPPISNELSSVFNLYNTYSFILQSLAPSVQHLHILKFLNLNELITQAVDNFNQKEHNDTEDGSYGGNKDNDQNTKNEILEMLQEEINEQQFLSACRLSVVGD